MNDDDTSTRQNGDLQHAVNDSSSGSKNRISSSFSGFSREWSEDHGRLSRMGGLNYFAEYLEVTGVFEDFVEQCPLVYLSNNAPAKRDVLGTILLSVLEGHTRYAHISSLAGAHLDARTLGMGKIPCEDSIRGALGKLTEDAERTACWVRGCFDRLSPGSLEVPWVLDIDVTIKPVYGKQEGAVLGYNPAKPGRPSHAYHSFWVGHLRLCLGVQVRPGNESAGSYGLDPLIGWLEHTPRNKWPEFVRGDTSDTARKHGCSNWSAGRYVICSRSSKGQRTHRPL